MFYYMIGHKDNKRYLSDFSIRKGGASCEFKEETLGLTFAKEAQARMIMRMLKDRGYQHDICLIQKAGFGS